MAYRCPETALTYVLTFSTYLCAETGHSEQGNEAALILDGTNVRKAQSSDMSVSGVYTLNFTVGEYVDNKLYVRGYMIVQNLQTNNIETIYSLVESGSFNELK